MIDNFKIDISKSLHEISEIEILRVPKTKFESILIFFYSIFIHIFRLMLWLWLHLFLRLRGPKEGEIFENIVIYFNGMLGDVSVHIPALTLIRNSYKNSHITCICNSEGFPIKDYLMALGLFDNCITISSHPVVRNGFNFSMDDSIYTNIRSDLFINFSPYSNRGVLGFVAREMVFAKMLGAKCYAGDLLSFYGTGKFSNQISRFFVKNEPRRSQFILRSLGLDPNDVESGLPIISSLPSRLLKYDAVGNLIKYAVINPGAKFKVKRWPTSYFAQITQYLHDELGLEVYITGSSGEGHLGDEIGLLDGNKSISLCGKTSLPELVEVLRGAELIISNDTGPMHLASLMNRPTIAIFGTRMSLTHWYPVGKNTTVIAHYHEDSFSFDDLGLKEHRLERIAPSIVKGQIEDFIAKGTLKIEYAAT